MSEFQRRWKHEVNIKQFLTSDDVTPEIAENVVRELKRVAVFRDEDDFEIQDALADMLDAGNDGDTDMFNSALSVIYDRADEHRVWLGL